MDGQPLMSIECWDISKMWYFVTLLILFVMLCKESRIEYLKFTIHAFIIAATHSLHSQNTFVDALYWNLNMNKIFSIFRQINAIVLTYYVIWVEYI